MARRGILWDWDWTPENAGELENVDLFSSAMLTPEDPCCVFPSKKTWGNTYTIQPTRTHLRFAIGQISLEGISHHDRKCTLTLDVCMLAVREEARWSSLDNR